MRVFSHPDESDASAQLTVSTYLTVGWDVVRAGISARRARKKGGMGRQASYLWRHRGHRGDAGNQAHTLDLIFNNLTRRAVANMQEGYVPVAETYLRLALKAQSQSRASIESLAQIKNPPVVYARQAYLANGPQQVNNGVAAPRAPENEILPSRLSRHEHELLPDSRASALTSGVNPAMEAVGAINRTPNRRG